MGAAAGRDGDVTGKYRTEAGAKAEAEARAYRQRAAVYNFRKPERKRDMAVGEGVGEKRNKFYNIYIYIAAA